MPKDKKTKEKEGSSSDKKEEEPPKRKSSVVDPSSGGSSSSESSSSSEASGNSSDHSGSGDSEFGFDEKATMTGDGVQSTSGGPSNGHNIPGSSNSSSSSDSTAIPTSPCNIRDRTAEMVKLMSEKQKQARVLIVNDTNEIPISDSSHMMPIENNLEGTSTSSSSPSTSIHVKSPPMQNKNMQQQNAKNCAKNGRKPKQLTKKQRKELEKREQEKHVGSVALLMNNNAKPIRKAPAPPPPIEMLVGREDQQLHVHHFNDWSGNEAEDREMIARGSNAAARLSQKNVSMPFYHGEENSTTVRFTDLQKNALKRYHGQRTSIKEHVAFPAAVKLLQRMGCGVAGSGIPDAEPLMLTAASSTPFMRYNFHQYVASGSKINNWRLDYLSSVQMDQSSHEEVYYGIATQLKKIIDQIVDDSDEQSHRLTLLALRDGNVEDLMQCFGDIERNLRSKEHAYQLLEDEAKCRRFDSLDRKARMSFIAEQVLLWSNTTIAKENATEANDYYNASMLMYLSGWCPGDKKCETDNHRKCQMLHFLLSRIENKRDVYEQKFFGGNTLLHFAAMTGSPCQVDILLQQGAGLSVLNELYRSPIALAQFRNCTLPARQMMWHGADIGGALSLDQIRPTNADQTYNKELSLYLDSKARETPYKAREFMVNRLQALNNTFISWVEAILLDADRRLLLAIDSLKSSLHQVPIRPDPLDKFLFVYNRDVIQKTFEMSIEPSTPEFEKEPIVLFFIPCQYTRFDSTMLANFPHIFRVPMLTEAAETAQRIADIDKDRQKRGQPREGYLEELEDCNVIRLFETMPTITYGDGNVTRTENLQSFFSSEHNGIIYAYNMCENIKKSSQKSFPIEVKLTIPKDAAEKFDNCFFMVQALQLTTRVPMPGERGYRDMPVDNDIVRELARRRAGKLKDAERMTLNSVMSDSRLLCGGGVYPTWSDRREQIEQMEQEQAEDQAAASTASLLNAEIGAAMVKEPKSKTD